MNQVELLWQAYHRKLLFFIQSRVDSAIDAEDLLQDIFLKLHRQIDALEDESKIESWLFQVARNSIIDYYRSRKLQLDLPEWLIEPESDEVETIRHELSACLEPLIKQLPEKYQQAMLFSEIEGKTQQALALELNLSLSAAKSRVQRGRKLLKEKLSSCCAFELSENNEVTDYHPKNTNCGSC